MTTFNVVAGGRAQVLLDEQQLAQMQAELARRAGELERLKAAMETLTSINTPAHFMAASMALCNELASRWKAERVGVGFLRGRYVRLQALSHTEKITRHMQLVQDIEAAMEECLDQDLEVQFPPTKDASYVYRSAEKLSAKQGPNAVCSVPLRRSGEVVAVLTVERTVQRPMTLEELETLRLTCDLFTARLVDLYENDRWIGAKAAKSLRKSAAWFVGAKHTWPKVAAIAVCGLLAFATFCKGEFKVEAPFAFQSSETQVVPAPFDGFLKSVDATIGDLVWTEESSAPFNDLDAMSPLVGMLPKRPASVLATLNTAELRSQRSEAAAEMASAEQQANIARAQGMGKEGEVKEAEADADKYRAQVDLYDWRIARAAIKTPVDGVIFNGDLKQKLGAPVHVGDELFQVGAREKLRAELTVPEDQIAELQVNQHGELAASTYPGQHIGFTVERINPVSVVSDQHNVYKVRVVFDKGELKPWMKPGIEGIAKVNVGRARYMWLWTHRLVNWVRMKLWV
jgi:hypothetical protein